MRMLLYIYIYVFSIYDTFYCLIRFFRRSFWSSPWLKWPNMLILGFFVFWQYPDLIFYNVWPSPTSREYMYKFSLKHIESGKEITILGGDTNTQLLIIFLLRLSINLCIMSYVITFYYYYSHRYKKTKHYKTLINLTFSIFN